MFVHWELNLICMSNFKEIVDYLKIFRDENLSQSEFIAIVDIDFDEKNIFEEDLKSVKKQDLYSNSTNSPFYNLEKNDNDKNLDTIYLLPQQNGKIYYYKKINLSQNNDLITKYKRVPDYLSDQLEDLDSLTLTPISITSSKGYFFDQINEKIIYANILNEINVSNDVIKYDPNDIKNQNGSLIIDESDLQNNKEFSVGHLIGNKEIIDRDINTFSVKNREVDFFKNNKAGLVNKFPTIDYNKTIVYAYYEKGISVNTKFAKFNSAISIKFKTHFLLLEFLNHTIFYDFDNLDQFSGGLKLGFINGYINYIDFLINKNSTNFIEVLQVLYYIPAYVLKITGYTFLWDLLDRAIIAGFITEDRNANKESFLIHILEGLYESYQDKSFFLLHLLSTIQGKTRLEHLHYRIDTDNNNKLIQLLFKAWKKSRFIDPSTNKNQEFITTNGPLFLPYESQKWAGFYFSNANVKFKKQEIEVELETGNKTYETVKRKTEDGVWIDDIKETEIVENYNYHPFHPIYISNIEKQDTTIAFESIIPAFLLYVNENKAWWNNFVKTGEYIVDILTISSGFASLKGAKYFAHVAKLAEAAEGVSGAEKVIKAANILKNIKNAAGVIEMSSGSVNLMLKLTELDETEFGESLSKVLFYLELITLVGELTAPMKANLKKSAKEVIEKSNPRIRKANRQLFDELYRITGIDELGLKILRVKNIEDFGSQGNKIIFQLLDNDGNEIGDLIRTIAEKGRKLNFNLKIKGKSYSISSSTELLNPQTAKVYDLPVNHGENIMYADLNIPTEITDKFSGLGNIMLDDTLAFYLKNPKFGKVDGCFGVWVTNPSYYDQYGGTSINLKQFWKVVDEQKMSYEEAAFETFTGKWVEKNGFKKVSYNRDNHIKPEQVIMKFLKY